jgi:hypothetical protein
VVEESDAGLRKIKLGPKEVKVREKLLALLRNASQGKRSNKMNHWQVLSADQRAMDNRQTLDVRERRIFEMGLSMSDVFKAYQNYLEHHKAPQWKLQPYLMRIS